MIEVNNFTKFSVDKKFLKGVAKNVLRGENREKENLSIVFVDPLIIRKINKKYKKKDKPTDVLSFARISGFPGDFSEVIICPSVVRRNAKLYKVSFKKELLQTAVHGILHVLGYDHQQPRDKDERMFKRQKYYLSKI